MASGPGPSLPVSFIVLGAGVAIAIAGGVGTGVKVAHSVFASPVVSLPAHLHRHLDKGTYQVYQRTGDTHRGNGFTFSNDGPPGLSPSGVTVTSATGESVPTTYPGNLTETINRGSGIFTGAVRFDVPSAGDYDVDIRAQGGIPQAIVTRTLGDTVRGAVPWLLTVAGGVLLATAGLVMLIAGIVRRGRASARGGAGYTPAYAAMPPPGWFPDPGGSGRQRWWDGARWTDHLG